MHQENIMNIVQRLAVTVRMPTGALIVVATLGMAVVDEAAAQKWPEKQATHECESHRGDFNRPFEELELREKFHELAGLVLTPEGVAKLERAVDRSEHWASVRELPELLRRFGKP